MWVVASQTGYGHKYWLKAVEGITIELSWEGLYNNATIFGPHKDAVDHLKLAKEKWPKDKIFIEPCLPF